MQYKKNKSQLKHLKEVQNNLLGAYPGPVNKYWKKEWLPFIKHDFDYSGLYIIDLLIYKIEKMKLYMESFNETEDKENVIASMQDALNVGYTIREDEYENKAMEFSEDHCYYVIELINKIDNKEVFNIKRMIPHTQNIERDNIEAEMNKECDSWKLNHPQINTYNMFSGEWDNQRNYTQWKLMLEDAWEDRRKDIQLFFSIIANNIDKWSD
jgi:hypothetical protein